MAKFGQLYLQGGRWRDKTIIDAGFIRQAWRPSPAASHYGLFWWRWVRENPRIGPVHFANGIKGQRIYVVPKHGIVIALSANLSDADAQKAYPALVRAIVSAVQSNGPINQSAADTNRLAEQLRMPFSGKPGNPVSESGQDFPRLPKIESRSGLLSCSYGAIRMNVDVTFAPASTETEAARQATKTLPIVFANHADPVGLGHVASLTRPGGNITGLSV